jgi:hypothetical protein
MPPSSLEDLVSSTGLQLITDALLICGAHAAGEAVADVDSAQGLRMLNQMLDSWRLESLLVYAIDRQVVNLVAAQGTYTIGTGGDFNLTRPVKIERAGFVDNSVSPALELPMRVLSDNEYQEIVLKGLQSPWAYWLYYDQAYPLGNVVLWPVPTLTRQVALYLWHPLSQVASTGTTVDLPPGYEKAIVWNLALDLAPTYGRELSPMVLKTAIDAKAAIKIVNSAPQLLKTDVPRRGRGGSRGGAWAAWSEGDA